MKIRQSAVAGVFYPSNENEIRTLLHQCTDKERDKIDYSLAQNRIIGGVVPHAGIIYSGYHAVHFYEIVNANPCFFDTIVLLTPNHSGYGNGDVNVDDNLYWQTPLGSVEVDTDFVRELNLPLNGDAHKSEHSGEVQIPFLQILVENCFKIVPIALNTQSYKVAQKVAHSIFDANTKLNKKILIVASSDFSHYVSPSRGEKMDDMVLQHILNMDSKAVERVVRQHHITVCGYGPIISLMEYCSLVCDNAHVKILRRGHSGEISYSDSVVDYISILFMDK